MYGVHECSEPLFSPICLCDMLVVLNLDLCGLLSQYPLSGQPVLGGLVFDSHPPTPRGRIPCVRPAQLFLPPSYPCSGIALPLLTHLKPSVLLLPGRIRIDRLAYDDEKTPLTYVLFHTWFTQPP